jgi:hypothetical protein
MKIENVRVYDIEESIRAAKFPMSTDTGKLNSDLTAGIKALAKSPKGEGHDNWLNGIRVAFDLTFTNKAWTELQRYHFIDFVSSQSTMHRITRFDLKRQYNEYVDQRIIAIMKEKVVKYNEAAANGAGVEELNNRYLEILYSNPAGFELTARLTTNYRQLKTIYSQRKSHRLPEWREFCRWIETLPFAADLIL